MTDVIFHDPVEMRHTESQYRKIINKYLNVGAHTDILLFLVIASCQHLIFTF